MSPQNFLCIGSRLLTALALVCVGWGGGLGVETAWATQSLIVTTTVDEDNATSDPAFGTETSLREAINWANAGGVNSAITFSPTVFAAPRKTITLNGTQLVLGNNGTVSITAPAVGVEISGNNAGRVFPVFSNANATLTRLTIRNGNAAGDNGGVYNFGGLLALDSCTLSANSAAFGLTTSSPADESSAPPSRHRAQSLWRRLALLPQHHSTG